MILAIDPGPTESAWVLYDIDTGEVIDHGKQANEDVSLLRGQHYTVIEMIASYGMPVGKDVFETCVWIGRFIERSPVLAARLTRGTVKMHLCNSMRAKDGNVRQAIIDRYPATGGGKVPQIGTKAKPGPLYGISGDEWAALGVAITACESRG